MLADKSCFVRRQAVVEAFQTNQSLTDIKAEGFDPAARKAWFKHVQTVSRCFGKCSGCGPSLAGDFIAFPTPQAPSNISIVPKSPPSLACVDIYAFTLHRSSEFRPLFAVLQILPASPLPRGTGKSLEEEQIHQRQAPVRRAGPFQGGRRRCPAPVINTSYSDSMTNR